MHENAARVDELWTPSIADAGAAPHLEANRWLTPVICTASGRKGVKVEPKEIQFLGHTILWTQDRDRPFPDWVAQALLQMLDFHELLPNWDSYGGRGLQKPAVGTTLQLIMDIHQRGHRARLVPLSDGGLGVRLERDGAELEFDIAANGSVEGLIEGANAEHGIGPGATLAEAKQLLDQYVAI